MTETEVLPRERLREAVRFYYDIQKFRITSLQRVGPKQGEGAEIDLSAEDQEYLDRQGAGLKALEKDALKQITRYARTFACYEWLIEQRGVGPTIAGFLLSEFDPHKAPRPSNFWSYAGLAVENGASPRPKKGEKLKWNRWLRAKCVFVLGGALLKAVNEEYREFYDNYRHRWQTTVGQCQLCNGTGKATKPKRTPGPHGPRVSEDAGKSVKCWNCLGDKDKETGRLSGKYTPDRAPKGKGDAHRHQAALRYMVKMFLLEFWKVWREAEGLPLVPSYHEAKQGGHR